MSRIRQEHLALKYKVFLYFSPWRRAAAAICPQYIGASFTLPFRDQRSKKGPSQFEPGLYVFVIRRRPGNGRKGLIV